MIVCSACRIPCRALTLLALTMGDLFTVFRQVGGFDRPVVDRTGLVGLYDVSVPYQSAARST